MATSLVVGRDTEGDRERKRWVRQGGEEGGEGETENLDGRRVGGAENETGEAWRIGYLNHDNQINVKLMCVALWVMGDI